MLPRSALPCPTPASPVSAALAAAISMATAALAAPLRLLGLLPPLVKEHPSGCNGSRAHHRPHHDAGNGPRAERVTAAALAASACPGGRVVLL